MKNIKMFLLCLAVAASPVFTAFALQAETISLTLATYAPSTSMNVSGVPIFMKAVEQKSQGRLKIDWRGGPELTSGKKQPAAVQKGVYDMSVAWAYVMHVPLWRAVHLSTLNPLEERKSGFYEFGNKHFEKQGFRYLGRMTFDSPFVIVSTKKAEKPADLKGLGFRTSGIYEPIIDLVGGVKVKVNSKEVYSALQQGLIQVRPSPMPTVIAYNLYEVAKYWVGPSFFPQGNTVLAMNLKKYNSLPADLQKVLIDSMEETERQLIPLKRKEFNDAWKQAQKNGMKRVLWPKDVSQKFFNDVMDMSWKRAEKKLGKDVISKMRPMISK